MAAGLRTGNRQVGGGRRSGFRRGVLALVCSGVVAWTADNAAGAIIDDPSYFDAIPHTYIDFEHRADGTPLDFPPGGGSFVPLNEYVPLGMGVSGVTLAWVHDSGADQMAAIALGGSPENSLRFFRNNPFDSFGLLWIPPVRSIGFFVVMNNSVNAPPPKFIFNSRGVPVGEVTFEGSLIQGTIGVIDYGYVGFEAPDDMLISAMLISSDFAWSMDDLRFSYVPAPGVSILLPGWLMCLASRRSTDPKRSHHPNWPSDHAQVKARGVQRLRNAAAGNASQYSHSRGNPGAGTMRTPCKRGLPRPRVGRGVACQPVRGERPWCEGSS